jgi:hypothetical protein
MAQESSHEAHVNEGLRPLAPVTVRFDNYIRSHECWVSQPPIVSNDALSQLLGRLSDLWKLSALPDVPRHLQSAGKLNINGSERV